MTHELATVGEILNLGSLAADGRYLARIAATAAEVTSALSLRHEVFNVEIAGGSPGGIEADKYDQRCQHLIVVERETGRTVGTYRLNSIGSVAEIDDLYSFGEFTIEDLPRQVLEQGVEIGRACIAADHRNTKVLFLLWKALANYLVGSGRHYFFGCCSIFTRERADGERAFRHLAEQGYFHKTFRVEPRKNALYSAPANAIENEPVKLPGLFEMYLRIGAKVCGPPMQDEQFGTVDFFVVFDLENIGERYRRMFFS